MPATTPFLVGLTRDHLNPDGSTVFLPKALEVFAAQPGLVFEYFPDYHDEITAAEAAKYDAIITMKPKFGKLALSGNDRRVKVVARFGVGFDNVDVEACTRAGVVVTNTPDGVRRPVATIIMTFILALSHKLFMKDRLVRTGRWNDRTLHMGEGLSGKTVGAIGAGNIGREAFRLLKPLDMVHIAYDPIAKASDLAAMGVELVDLDTLLKRADFVSVSCPLSEATRGLVGARELGLMKKTAYLINTARGPIVDEKALYKALTQGTIAGAALDVFEQEPTPADNPILRLDNVIVTPHALCWTDECFLGIATDAFSSAVAIARGQAPKHVVNRAVLEHPEIAAILATGRG